MKINVVYYMEKGHLHTMHICKGKATPEYSKTHRHVYQIPRHGGSNIFSSERQKIRKLF